MSRNAKQLLILACWCRSLVDGVHAQARLSARDVWAFEQLQLLAADVIGRDA